MVTFGEYLCLIALHAIYGVEWKCKGLLLVLGIRHGNRVRFGGDDDVRFCLGTERRP